MIESGGEGISRRELLAGAGGVAGAALVTAAATPLASLGPADRHPRNAVASWRAPGRRRRATRIRAERDPDRQLLHGAARGQATRRLLGAGAARGEAAPNSSTCRRRGGAGRRRGSSPTRRSAPTPAARSRSTATRLYAPTSDGPAFTCPCHYSTFLPGEGGRLVFGPAGRALPQLPLMIDDDGNLRAAGRFDEDIGPSWWGVPGRSRELGRTRSPHRRSRRAARWHRQRLGAGPAIKWALRYVFPDHWSFLLGEIALYSFIVLVVTGIYPDAVLRPQRHAGRLPRVLCPLLRRADVRGLQLGAATSASTSRQGCLIRQTHHWAADVFIASIVLHLMRVFFTGAYRKPRDLNWMIGLTMLMLAILEGFAGYSLVDDLLSGMGLAIAYWVALSIPFIGGQLAILIWGGQFPGSGSFLSRLEIVHVFLIPARWRC